MIYLEVHILLLYRVSFSVAIGNPTWVLYAFHIITKVASFHDKPSVLTLVPRQLSADALSYLLAFCCTILRHLILDATLVTVTNIITSSSRGQLWSEVEENF